MKNKLNQLSKDTFCEAVDMFENLEKIKKEIQRLNMVTINVKISTAKMGDNLEAKALSQTGEIISNALNEMIHEIDSLEVSSARIKEMSKEIGKIVNEEDNYENQWN